jgi:hypothetical protein
LFFWYSSSLKKHSQEISISVDGKKKVFNTLADYVIDEPHDQLSCPIKNLIKRIIKEN